MFNIKKESTNNFVLSFTQIELWEYVGVGGDAGG